MSLVRFGPGGAVLASLHNSSFFTSLLRYFHSFPIFQKPLINIIEIIKNVSTLTKKSKLKSDSKREANLWNYYKERAFKGSLRHLLFSLYHDRSPEEGYDLYHATTLNANLIGFDEFAVKDSIIYDTDEEYNKYMEIPRILAVRYLNEIEERNYLNFILKNNYKEVSTNERTRAY